MKRGHFFLQLVPVADLRGGGGGGSMGSVEAPFVPQIHPEKPENGVSDIPGFKIFRGSPLACHTFGAHKFEPPFTKSWIRPRVPTTVHGQRVMDSDCSMDKSLMINSTLTVDCRLQSTHHGHVDLYWTRIDTHTLPWVMPWVCVGSGLGLGLALREGRVDTSPESRIDCAHFISVLGQQGETIP